MTSSWALPWVRVGPWSGAALAMSPVTPSSAVEALRAVLLQGGCKDVEQCLAQDGGWALLKTSAGHEEGVSRLAR